MLSLCFTKLSELSELGLLHSKLSDFLPNSDLSSPKKELLGLELIEILMLMIVALHYCMHQNLLLVGQIPLQG